MKDKETVKKEGREAVAKAGAALKRSASFGARGAVFAILVYGVAAATLYALPYVVVLVGNLVGISENPSIQDVVVWLFSGLFLLGWILFLEFSGAKALKKWFFPPEKDEKP